MQDIGLKMAKLRSEAGLTTTALAALVGISQAQISRLENGRQGFRVSTPKKIADGLDVHISVFFIEETKTESEEAETETPIDSD